METSINVKDPWSGKPEPRTYQWKAYKAAREGNRIIVLPTGAIRRFGTPPKMNIEPENDGYQ